MTPNRMMTQYSGIPSISRYAKWLLNIPASELVAFVYPVESGGTHPVVVVGYFVGRRATCLKQACPMLQLDYSH